MCVNVTSTAAERAHGLGANTVSNMEQFNTNSGEQIETEALMLSSYLLSQTWSNAVVEAQSLKPQLDLSLPVQTVIDYRVLSNN